MAITENIANLKIIFNIGYPLTFLKRFSLGRLSLRVFLILRVKSANIRSASLSVYFGYFVVGERDDFIYSVSHVN